MIEQHKRHKHGGKFSKVYSKLKGKGKEKEKGGRSSLPPGESCLPCVSVNSEVNGMKCDFCMDIVVVVWTFQNSLPFQLPV